ncbi:MAG: biopolymer transporter ExbD [Candidatus Omnitrophica bacterium]|nr:biopolymer transporter ExbD [Candidatus Omnitrophota bacterium]
MLHFKPSEFETQRPAFQMTPMIDIVFLNLIFFMALFVYFQFETELNISVPKAEASTQARRTAGEIVINVMQDGSVVVNQKRLGFQELEALLKKTAEWYPGQAVILRADKRTLHEQVVRVLDVCAKAKVWNISFATTKER